MKFVNELIDKQNTKDPKALCGILGFITIIATTIMYPTQSNVIVLAGLSAGALGISAWEVNKTTQNNNQNNQQQ